MRTRAGFTLVEMMVAMALTVFVMVILSQCFVAGLETFSGLKAIGDLQEELRTAATLIRSDLAQDHFEGKRRLSDPPGNLAHEKIREGFFSIGQSYPGDALPVAISEGIEDNIPSFRATHHWMHFTVKRRGNARERFFSATTPGSTRLSGLVNPVTPPTTYFAQPGDSVFQDNASSVNSAWAEIVYLLLPTGTTANPSLPGGPGTPLGALYRCQYVILPRTDAVNNAKPAIQAAIADNHPPSPRDALPYTNIAGVTTSAALNMHFFNPNDMAAGYTTRTFNPYTYFRPPPVNNNHPPRGAALVLSNVVSFQVRVLKSTGFDFDDLGLANIGRKVPFDTANYANPVQLPQSIYGANNVIPASPPYSIQGLQIILRIYDPRSQLTRQVTILQDM